MVTCNHTHHDLSVAGAFIIPTTCSLHSSSISLKAHLVLDTQMLSSIPGFLELNTSLPYHHLSIPRNHIRFLPANESSQFTLQAPHITYGFPTLMSFLPISFLAILVFFYRAHLLRTHQNTHLSENRHESCNLDVVRVDQYTETHCENQEESTINTNVQHSSRLYPMMK